MITDTQLHRMEMELHERLSMASVDVAGTADFATRALRRVIAEYRCLRMISGVGAKPCKSAQD